VPGDINRRAIQATGGTGLNRCARGRVRREFFLRLSRWREEHAPDGAGRAGMQRQLFPHDDLRWAATPFH
jgi:hypothetical protein